MDLTRLDLTLRDIDVTRNILYSCVVDNDDNNRNHNNNHAWDINIPLLTSYDNNYIVLNVRSFLVKYFSVYFDILLSFFYIKSTTITKSKSNSNQIPKVYIILDFLNYFYINFSSVWFLSSFTFRLSPIVFHLFQLGHASVKHSYHFFLTASIVSMFMAKREREASTTASIVFF